MATPGYGHVPYNPLQGEQANLRQEGTSPYCAMFQVAAEDTYTNYVICRGFDTRILRFVDYASGDASKPGISVAKPFGKRRAGTYEIGEIYPALLPTQGNDEFTGFRQVTYVPPVPVAVQWRVGQNPGVVTGGGLDGGQPADLTDAIEILYDHNAKVVNWLLIDNTSSAGGTVEYVITSAGATEGTGPYTGLKKVAAVIKCGTASQIGQTIDVIDHSGGLFDEADMTGYTGWAFWGKAWSLAAGAACETLTPSHWIAHNRVCDPDTGVYAEPCP
mgnify:CR=1 FL=1